MNPQKTTVDWFRFRAKAEPREILEALRPAYGHIGEHLSIKSLERGILGFQRACTINVGDMPLGRMDFGGESQRDWVRVDIGGKGCEWMNDWSEIHRVEALESAQLRRLDIALTTWEGQITHDMVVQAHTAGRFTIRRPPELRQITSSDPRAGRTCYIGKREAGIDRGIHFHILVICDGHKHRDALNLTRLLGEYWVAHCGTAEDGTNKSSYFNCYTRKDEYEYNCLGLIHPTDRSMMRGLRFAIEYLCKETSQLKPSPPKAQEGPEGALEPLRKGIRNLRKGIMPKGHSGRGAPRSSGLDTSVIEQELLKK